MRGASQRLSNIPGKYRDVGLTRFSLSLLPTRHFIESSRCVERRAGRVFLLLRAYKCDNAGLRGLSKSNMGCWSRVLVDRQFWPENTTISRKSLNSRHSEQTRLPPFPLRPPPRLRARDMSPPQQYRRMHYLVVRNKPRLRPWTRTRSWHLNSR